MTPTKTLPVIAGIDGSPEALHAALWAVDEAVLRDAPLRLVYATKSVHMSADEYADEVHRGHEHLHQARDAIEATGKHVAIETAIADGPPGAALLSLSDGAQMLCVGSVGINAYARSILGSTAADLAEKALCPVAVIRADDRDGGDERGIGWIVVALKDHPDTDAVVAQAMAEARLRGAPVLALGEGTSPDSADALERRIGTWKSRYPDVHVYPINNRADAAHFLKGTNEPVQLAVIGSSDAGEVAQIVGQGHPMFHHAICSVIVVHP